MNLEHRVKNEEALRRSEKEGTIRLLPNHQYPLFDISTEYIAHLKSLKDDFSIRAFHEFGSISQHFKQKYYGYELTHKYSRFH